MTILSFETKKKFTKLFHVISEGLEMTSYGLPNMLIVKVMKMDISKQNTWIIII